MNIHSNLGIIPHPHYVTLGEGQFQLSKSTTIGSPSDLACDAICWFYSAFHSLSGVALTLEEKATEPRENFIWLYENPALLKESYSLHVTPTKIEIGASDKSGFLYGLVSLLQIVPLEMPDAPGEWLLPVAQIEDEPRFAWRGLMLDSARYFQPVSWIKKFLDLMTLYKFNVFHWHLTDDQGWRIEVEKYPALTTVSAWRTESRLGHEDEALEGDPKQGPHDGKPHGGFYSQLELREIVSYASARGIVVVPEIEMPGHATEVLAAYPNLSCAGTSCEVSTHWGAHYGEFCAGNDEVLSFLEAVLEEVLAVFPSQFIHIGGDECPKIRWEHCPKCQLRIREHNLKDEDELQSWFVRHFDRFLRERGRRLIGWDEILEGGLAPSAAVMSWRGEAGGIAAAQAGHDVVMTPYQSVYFDRYQSLDHAAEPLTWGQTSTLRHVYAYEPIPAALPESAVQHVLGSQGALWTEYMPRPDIVEYNAFPRACALAEVFWSNKAARDYTDFLARLNPHLRLLSRMNVNYRSPTASDATTTAND